MSSLDVTYGDASVAASSPTASSAEFAQAAAESAIAAAASGPASTRPDGRLPSEIRPLSVEHGLLSRADGSCSWSCGNGTTVLAAVYGPTVTGAQKDERPDRATLSVNFKAESGSANNIDIERGSYIRQSLEPLLLLSAHPRCRIQLNLQIIRDGGSVLAAAINAASLALLDAGVASTALLSAVTISLKEVDRAGAGSSKQVEFETLLDPIQSEVDSSAATVTLAFASTTAGTILSVFEAGSMDQQAYFDTIQYGRAACAHVQSFMKLSIERRQAAANP